MEARLLLGSNESVLTRGMQVPSSLGKLEIERADVRAWLKCRWRSHTLQALRAGFRGGDRPHDRIQRRRADAGKAEIQTPGTDSPLWVLAVRQGLHRLDPGHGHFELDPIRLNNAKELAFGRVR